MEQKKKLLIKVLKKLQPHWNLAEGILALINKGFYSEEMIDKIILIINDAVKETKSQKRKESFKKAAQVIKKIREQEQFEKTEEDVDSLLATI